jgi:hypothetical protein
MQTPGEPLRARALGRGDARNIKGLASVIYTRALASAERKLNSDLILVAPDDPARVAWMPMTRQPKAEYGRYVIGLIERQFRAAVGYIDQCAVS